MKTLIIFIALSFVFCAQIFGQENSTCATISVSSPTDLVFSNPPYTFTAKVEGVNLDKIGYSWTLSGGKIVDGQGTPLLKVVFDDSQSVKATVEITGLPENCPRTVSVATSLDIGCRLPRSKKLDEFSLLPLLDYRIRLDDLFISLNNEADATGYILETFKKNTSPSVIEKRLNGILAHARFRKFPTQRLNLYITNEDKNLTEFWIVFSGENPPGIDNAVQIDLQNYKRDLPKLFIATQKVPSRKTKRKN